MSRSDIDEAMQRNDFLRVLSLSLASNGIVDVNAPAILRDIEEQGYTYRLTTDAERSMRNAHAAGMTVTCRCGHGHILDAAGEVVRCHCGCPTFATPAVEQRCDCGHPWTPGCRGRANGWCEPVCICMADPAPASSRPATEAGA